MSTRDFNDLFKEIKSIIEGDKLNNEVNNIRRSIEELKNTDFYNEIQKVFMACEYDLKEAKETVERAITSPIYVGVIGHYSHGKSSLLNAMFLNQHDKEDGLLPIGEGVVTGKPTLIQFKDNIESHEFFKVYPDGSEESISEEEYKQMVTTKGKIQLSDVSIFRIMLSVNQLAGHGVIFKNMAKNNIEIFDTPGLGGPYWKDEKALLDCVEQFKIIILCIKATEINSRVAEQVNPFLKISTSPIIVTLTFWDMWKGSEDYLGIVDEDGARKKAKDLILKYFPTLESCVEENRIIYCSPKGYFQKNKMTLPKDMEKYYTEEWNIDNVRNALLNYVTLKKATLLPSIPHKSSTLAKSKIDEVAKKSEKLLKSYKDLRDKLLEVSEKMKPSPKIFKEIRGKFSKKAKEELQLLVHNNIKDFEMRFQKELKKGEISTSELVETLNSEFKSRMKREINEYDSTLDDLIEKEIIRELERYIKREKTAINPEQIDELENEIKEEIKKDLIGEMIKTLERINIFLIYEESLMDLGSKVNQTIFTLINGIKKRKILFAFGIVFIISAVVSLYFKVFPVSAALFLLGIGTFVFIFILEIMSEVNRREEEKKRKLNQLRKENSKEELEKRISKIYNLMDDTFEKINELIEEKLISTHDVQSEVIKEIKSLARSETLNTTINNLELSIAELRKMK